MKVENEPDFIASRRFGYSLMKLEERYPEVCPDHVIAAALLMTEEDVAVRFEQLTEKLRTLMGVSL